MVQEFQQDNATVKITQMIVTVSAVVTLSLISVVNAVVLESKKVTVIVKVIL